jgi:hypothetical protein
VTHEKSDRRRNGFHGRRHAGARRATYGAGRSRWRQEAVRGRLGAAFVQTDQLARFVHRRVFGHYERDGEIKIVDGALDSPSKREIARQERMKSED